MPSVNEQREQRSATLPPSPYTSIVNGTQIASRRNADTSICCNVPRVPRIRPDWPLRLALQVACRVSALHAVGFSLLACSAAISP
jgi:hypothetical protein